MSDRIQCKLENVKSAIMIYSILAVVLFIAVLPMPYGYYTFIRIAVFALTAWLSYKHWGTLHHMNNIWFWIFGAIAILFNPFVKVQLEREIWMLLDATFGILFTVLAVLEYKNRKNSKNS